MKAIIAVNNLGYIGLNNGLPWKCKEDLKKFRELTLQSQIRETPLLLVGYRTAQTLPNLKGRITKIPDRFISFDKQAQEDNYDWCIGGKKTYESFCHLFTELHISHIDDNTIGDTTFPDLKNLNPNCKVFNYYFKADE